MASQHSQLGLRLANFFFITPLTIRKRLSHQLSLDLQGNEPRLKSSKIDRTAHNPQPLRYTKVSLFSYYPLFYH
jgi:hypothetical protein